MVKFIEKKLDFAFILELMLYCSIIEQYKCSIIEHYDKRKPRSF